MIDNDPNQDFDFLFRADLEQKAVGENLGLIFYTLITPTGLFTRLFGRDELLLKKKDKKSYWLA